MENLLLHICCAPCASYPLERLRADFPALRPKLWYYNPNIHPKAEFRRRRDGVAYLALRSNLEVDFSPPYNAPDFLAEIASASTAPERCRLCYALRFKAAAQEAKRLRIPFWSTTLLYSRRQKHELIIEEARAASANFGVEFYYEDWRIGWHRGAELSRELELYRQNYCGCIYSELER